MAVKVITDSTSYIDPQLRKELDIKVVSLYVSFPGNSMKETEIDNAVFYSLMEKEGIPVSSQPSGGELYEAMETAVSRGDDVFGVFLSADMSGTYASACQVKTMVLEKYPQAQIEIMDSRSNSMQLGFAAIVAARAALAGQTLAQVKRAAKENIARSRFLFIPDNLVYLQKGGRIGGAQALIGNLLRIIPVLTVENGVTTVLKAVRTKGRAVRAMLDKMREDHANYGIKEIIVHHINCWEQAQELAGKIQAKLQQLEVKIRDIGPVIGLHVGPGAIGIVYYTDRALR
ncbi:MAG: DegV family protein [Firmicutes bacterium]|nr:DegV family protein [Bacillota bacterium]